MKCYLCGDELTDENSSKEHIIPNALGGKLTAKILCKKCNNDLGLSFDSFLTKSLEWFSCKVNHSRSRGNIQPVKVNIDGMDVFALPGGTMMVQRLKRYRIIITVFMHLAKMHKHKPNQKLEKLF